MTIVHPGQTGYLVPRCPGFFAERLDSLLCSPSTLKTMRAAARPSVLQYSWQSIARSMGEVYEHVLNEEVEETRTALV